MPIPTIAAAIDARVLSSMKTERVRASEQITSATTTRVADDAREIIGAVRDALAAATVCAYAQGMVLLRAASAEHHWQVDPREIARIWTGGCIIRARLLDPIMQAFERAPDLPNLLLDAGIRSRVAEAERAWRRTVQTAVAHGIPVPALAASLSYFDSYRTAVLPQNITQAQRDYFGAHTYQRTDRPDAGFVHSDWPALVTDAATRTTP